MANSPSGKFARKAPAAKPEEKGPGQLGVDDLGNVTWQWNNDKDLLADDTLGAARRVRALVDPSLDVQDEGPTTHDPRNTRGLAEGYDPYGSGLLGKSRWKKKRSLKELSEWVELRKKFGGKPPV